MNTLFGNSRYDFQKEGKEPVHKMMTATKLGLSIGGFLAIFDATMKRPAFSTRDVFGRTGKYLFYWTALSTTYAATLLVCTNVRKKDDPFNYALAGTTTAGVLYSITKNGPLCYTLGMLGVIAGVMFKAAVNMGFKPFDYSDMRLHYYMDGINFDKSPDQRDLK